MLTAAGHTQTRPGTKGGTHMTEQDQTPGITGDDTKDDDTKGHIVSGGTDHDAQGDDPDSRTPSRTSLRGGGNRPSHVSPRGSDECRHDDRVGSPAAPSRPALRPRQGVSPRRTGQAADDRFSSSETARQCFPHEPHCCCQQPYK